MKFKSYISHVNDSCKTIMNKNTLITMGGVVVGVGIDYLTKLLYTSDNDINRYVAATPQIIPSLFILRGIVGNFREYLSDIRRIFRRDNLEPIDRTKMITAGLSMHFTGEYFQSLSFGYGHPFFSDIRMLPYWLFNIPGIYLIGKAIISRKRKC